MAARVAARQAKTVARILSPRSSVQAANLTQQRGLAGKAPFTTKT